MYVSKPALMALLSLMMASATAQSPAPDIFPEGTWTGTLLTRTIPDVDKDGEWPQDVQLSHCGGKILLKRRKDDGTYTDGFEMAVVPFRRMFVLAFLALEHANEPKGWIESQVWTLVDARPKAWTLSQSRAVFNQDMKPEDPWYTFRWLALGPVEFNPQGCTPATPQ